MRLAIVAAALTLTLTVPVAVRAHGGHLHTVMGTVTVSDDSHVEVRTKDGKTVSVRFTDKTTFARGTQKLDKAALAVGQRVVIDVGDGKEPMVARGVKLGAVDAKK